MAAHPFEVRDEVEIPASPEEIWEAVSTGPGLDAWFMGQTEIEPREGGATRTEMPGFTMESTVTTWDPPHRFAIASPVAEDGATMAFEYTIEGRAGGPSKVRLVHSGFLTGDGWEQEYEALKGGDPMYLRKLVAYVTYFRGRRAVPVEAFGQPADFEAGWARLRATLGVGADPALGDAVRFDVDGLPPIDGVVDEVMGDAIGVRTSDGLYRFIRGFDGSAIVLGHHLYFDVEREAANQAWQGWLERAIAA